MSTQFFSLCSRIEFKEIYFSGDSTDYQEYARVGMYESIPLGAGFKINLQGELSTDVAGRLLLGNNTLVRFEVSDHGYQGSFLLYSYDEETQTSTYIGVGSVINGYICIDIDDLFEKDAIFTGYVLPDTLRYHEFLHLDNNHTDLLINNALKDIPTSFSIINDTPSSVRQFAGDYLSVFINLNLYPGKSLQFLFKTSEVIEMPDDFDDDEPQELIRGFNVFIHTKSGICIAGKITYGGFTYDNPSLSGLSGTISSLEVLVPALNQYWNDSEDPSYHVMNIYLPHEVIHNLNNASYKVSAILYLHGGEWKSKGDAPFSPSNQIGPVIIDSSFESNNYLPDLLSRGFVVASMEYHGLVMDGDIIDVGESKYCASMLNDIQGAINFLYDNSSLLHIHNSKLCLWGYSSGGHLALLYSYINNSAYIPVKLVISEAGPTKVSDTTSDPFAIAMKGSESWNDVSPYEHCNHNLNLRTLLIHGYGFASNYYDDEDDGDGYVSHGDAVALCNEFGNTDYCELISISGCDHNSYSFAVNDYNGKLNEYLQWYRNLSE